MIRLALLDMYDGLEGLGIPNILSILEPYSTIQVDRFDVRGKCELPGLDYDLYISSGGPGSPLEGDGLWDRGYYKLMDNLWKYNEQHADKKYVFFICHSFQMIAHHLSLGSVVLRNKESFGVFPVHKTQYGTEEAVFKHLDDIFYIADFRKWQFIEPNHARMEHMGARILAVEKKRPHVNLERAVMAVRFSDEWIGTQFHPEADPVGMKIHFEKEDKKKEFIAKKGEDKYQQMLELIADKEKLTVTHEAILPTWLNESIQSINLQRKLKALMDD